MTHRSWMIVKSLGVRGLLLMALGFWVTAIIVSLLPSDPSSPGPSDVDTYVDVIMSGN